MLVLEQKRTDLVQEKFLGSLSTGRDATCLSGQGTEVASPRYISLTPVALGFHIH
jgi:hypothetical protein